MKRSTKSKMYKKRRKKEKLHQRKSLTQPILLRATATLYNEHGDDIYTKKYLERNPINKNPKQQNFTLKSITPYSQGLQLWWQTYCSAMEFHTRQQNACYPNNASEKHLLLEKYANEYETSSEEDSEVHEGSNEVPVEYVDEEYIKFLEITRKHREELSLKRNENV